MFIVPSSGDNGILHVMDKATFLGGGLFVCNFADNIGYVLFGRSDFRSDLEYQIFNDDPNSGNFQLVLNDAEAQMCYQL